MSARQSNSQLAERYRALLTEGAAFAMDAQTLQATKAWRNQLWKQFKDIEDRLCPLNVIDRERQANEPRSDSQQ